MKVIRFGLGIRFELLDLAHARESARQFWEEIFSVLSAPELSGLHLYGGVLEEGPHGQPDANYLCVLMGGGLKQMRRIFRKLDNDAGIGMYLCPSQPYLQNNALAHIEGLTYLGHVQRDGSLAGGDAAIEGAHIYMKHGKRRPAGKGIRFLLAPEAFGGMDAADVVKRMTIAARREFSGVRILPLPIAPGGAGMVDALLAACNGAARNVAVTGQYGGRVRARYGVLRGTTAVVEAASVREPRPEGGACATSYGVGEQIRRALDEGLEHIYIGMGDFFAADCGMGCLRALGAKPLDAEGREVSDAAALASVCRLDVELLHPRIRTAAFTMVYDGEEPFSAGGLCAGAREAGMAPEQARAAAQGAEAFLHVLEETFGAGIGELPGAGAAGGLGAAVLGALDAAFAPGVGALLDAAHFDRRMREVSLVVTGGAVLDQAALRPGRPLYELAQRCRKHHVPVAAIAGALPDGPQPLLAQGVGSVLALHGGERTPQAVQEQLDDAAESLFRLIRIGRQVERVTALRRKKK